MKYDLIIRNGTVIDGSGMTAWFRADVGVAGGKNCDHRQAAQRTREPSTR